MSPRTATYRPPATTSMMNAIITGASSTTSTAIEPRSPRRRSRSVVRTELLQWTLDDLTDGRRIDERGDLLGVPGDLDPDLLGADRGDGDLDVVQDPLADLA